MNQKIYIKDDVIISRLGFSTEENIQQISKGISAIKEHQIGRKTYFTSILQEEVINQQFQKIADIDAFTKLEKCFCWLHSNYLIKTLISIKTL